MNAQKLYEEVFNYLKTHPTLTDIDVLIEFPNSLNKKAVCVSLLRDSLVGRYECQDFIGLEISFSFYAKTFKDLNGTNNFEERVMQALKNFQPEKTTQHLVRRFFPLLITSLNLYNSNQVYRFYFTNE